MVGFCGVWAEQGVAEHVRGWVGLGAAGQAEWGRRCGEGALGGWRCVRAWGDAGAREPRVPRQPLRGEWSGGDSIAQPATAAVVGNNSSHKCPEGGARRTSLITTNHTVWLMRGWCTRSGGGAVATTTCGSLGYNAAMNAPGDQGDAGRWSGGDPKTRNASQGRVVGMANGQNPSDVSFTVIRPETPLEYTP